MYSILRFLTSPVNEQQHVGQLSKLEGDIPDDRPVYLKLSVRILKACQLGTITSPSKLTTATRTRFGPFYAYNTHKYRISS